MRGSIVIAVVALGLNFVTSQKLSLGTCPDVSLKSDFDISKFTGVWYEIEAFPAAIEKQLKCITDTYEDKGYYLSVFTKGINVTTGKEVSLEGNFTIPDPNVPAKLQVEFNSPPEGEVWVLDTDYENFLLMYSCSSLLHLYKTDYENYKFAYSCPRPLDQYKIDFLWIFSRQPTLDNTNRKKIYKVMKDNNISNEGLKPIVQDCA